MDINASNMSVIDIAYSKLFKDAFASADVAYEDYTTTIRLNATKIGLPWFEKFAGMREWIGDRQVKSLASKKLEYTERSFEDTVAVPRRDVETNTWGEYSTLIQQMGQAAGNQKGLLASEALTTNDTWAIDDKLFYAVDHAYGNYTINNYTTNALSETSFNVAYKLMSSYQDHQGNPLLSTPNVLRVGPALRVTAWNILKNKFAYNSTDKVQIENVNKDLVDLVIDKTLVGTKANYWFLQSTKGVIKPVIQNIPKKVVLTQLTKNTDANVFSSDEFLYGTNMYATTGKTFPHLCYGGFKS